MSDDETETQTYHIRARAVLLTWHSPNPDRLFHIINDFKARMTEEDSCLYKSWTSCLEKCPKTGNIHAHAYVEGHKQLDNCVSYWAFRDVKPNCAANKCTGSSYKVALHRGHFYLQCVHKIGYMGHSSNFHAVEDYPVMTEWIVNMFKMNKIKDDDVLPCCSHYHCITDKLAKDITAHIKYRGTVEREAFLEDRKNKLIEATTTFRTYPEITMWQHQWEYTCFRYKFLVLHGESGMGKTKFAQHLYKNPFMHVDGINWQGYDPVVNDAVIMDDIPEIYQYIERHKGMFQSNGIVTINASATNCYARDIDLVEKPIIVCTNDYLPHCASLWVHQNCVSMHIAEPMF